MTALFRIRIPWGTFGPDGAWTPNALLTMPWQEQLRQNIANGYHVKNPQPVAAAGGVKGSGRNGNCNRRRPHAEGARQNPPTQELYLWRSLRSLAGSRRTDVMPSCRAA